MKKILSLIVAVILVMSLAVTAFAQSIPVELNSDTVAGEGAVVENGVLTFSGNLCWVTLPAEVPLGETVTITIKGHSGSDFRAWLLSNDQHTFSVVDSATNALWKASEVEGWFEATGDFEYTITCVCVDRDVKGVHPAAYYIAFKAPSYDSSVTDLVIESLTVNYPWEVTIDEPEVEEPATEETPAEDTPAEETPAEDTPAETGLALAVLPAAIALAVVAFKKR